MNPVITHETYASIFAAIHTHCPIDVYDSFTFDSLVDMLHEVLTEKELSILAMRYGEKKTLDECGTAFEKSRESIRQTIDRIFDRIGHFERVSEYMTVSNRQYIETVRKLKMAETRVRVLTEKINAARENLSLGNDSIVPDPAENITLEKMYLSLRSYNALKNADCYTLKDVIEKYETLDDFAGIKNIGVKSASEIISKVHDCGFKMAWEK